MTVAPRKAPGAEEKACARCGEIKPLEAFPPMKTGKLGRYAYCRACHSAYQAARNPKRAEIDLRKSMRSQGLKRCSACREIQPLDEGFYPAPAGRPASCVGHCKRCLAARYRGTYLAGQYGLTEGDLAALLAFQGGACAICRRSFGRVRTNIDHSHATHEVRSVLCVNCNTKVLPLVERNPELVEAALAYLREATPASIALGRAQVVPATNQARRKLRRAA